MCCLACRRRSCLLRTRLPLYCACTLAALASASAAGAAGAEGAEGAEGAAGSVIVAVEVCICWCCCQWVMNDAKGVDIRRSRCPSCASIPINLASTFLSASVPAAASALASVLAPASAQPRNAAPVPAPG